MGAVRWGILGQRWAFPKREIASAVDDSRKAILDALKGCSSERDLEKGKSLHAAAVESGQDADIFVASSLVNMYAKCGSLQDAQLVFDRMKRHDVVAWNALLLGYADNGEGEAVLELFSGMKRAGCIPDPLTYVAALKACAGLAADQVTSLNTGMAIHFEAAYNRCVFDIRVGNTLLDMYVKCGSLLEACKVFQGLAQPDVVSWTALISGHADNGQGWQALELFCEMRLERSCEPDPRTYVAALKACTVLASREDSQLVDGKPVKLWSLEKGMALHCEVSRRGWDSNRYISSALINVYCKAGNVEHAAAVFSGVQRPDVVCWNALILGYAENGEGTKALSLYSRMDCRPSSLTFVSALKACTSMAMSEDAKQVDGRSVKLKSLEKGLALHDELTASHCEFNVFLGNTLIDMYSKCGCLDFAQAVFDGMRQHSVVSWNVLILAYADSGKALQALHLFNRMEQEGFGPDSSTFTAVLKACAHLATGENAKQAGGSLLKLRSLEIAVEMHWKLSAKGYDSSLYVANSLVDMYSKCGHLAWACRVFDGMYQHSSVSYNALILGYAENGKASSAVQLFLRMTLEGCQPDPQTFVVAFKAFSLVGALEHGRSVHQDVRCWNLTNNAAVATALIEFYAACWSMVEAEQVFISLETKDLVQWTALMAGYSRHGRADRVLELLQQMQDVQVRPDGVTLLSVLTACNHAGLVDQGRQCFENMRAKYGVEPCIEHYTCMVDMLGRANRLDNAVELLRNMPLKPDMVTWMAILGACRKWKNVELGKVAFESLSNLKSSSHYALMADLYNSSKKSCDGDAEHPLVKSHHGEHFSYIC